MSKQIKVGVIGGGLMGREVASAFGRWFALEDSNVSPSLVAVADVNDCLLYTSPSPRDKRQSRMPSSA